MVDLNFCDKVTPRQFKFESMGVEHPDYHTVVRDGWCLEDVEEYSDKILECSDRPNNCRSVLWEWSKEAFPNNKKKIDSLMKEISVLNEGSMSQEKAADVDRIKREIEKFWELEEKYWGQRSRSQWLKYGDLNSKFFHAVTVNRRQRNKVLRIRDDDGTWLEKDDEIGLCFKNFFTNLYSSGGSRDLSLALNFVERNVSSEMNGCLLKPVSSEEVKVAAFQLGRDKAPGPDGFSGWFYHFSWSDIGEQIVGLVRDFLDHGRDIDVINGTNIVLIPKVDKPEHVSQFRPIGLCNFVYKIISKVLVNRLKGFLPSLISEQQRAFILGRVIQDNVVIAHEVYHYMKNKRNGNRGEFALKIDMKKAYDKVEWDFLEEVMWSMGFDPLWVSKVMKCVKTVQYNLLLAGKKIASFCPERGLRQGDPLSPYLFLFVADVLSRMVSEAVQCGDLKGVKLARSCPMISHCFFADDSLFFLRATKENCINMKRILEEYCLASGQEANLDKSGIFFSANSGEDVKNMVCNCFEIPCCQNPGVYLGLPSIWEICKG